MSSAWSQEQRIEHYCMMVRRYVDAVNRKDLEGILSCYADDAEIHDPVGKRDLTGKPALREFYQDVITRAHMELVGPVRGSFGNAVAASICARIPGAEIDVITVTRFDEDGLIKDYSAFWGPGNMRPMET